MTLLDLIKKLCKKRGISVTMLENELGLPDNTIYQWKNRMPSVERLQVVADYFNVSI
ncbi:TPA_asm: helix-turn-helix domain-containing protein, partial [Listeria monocytogenes]|nr:helix-turn-helix domain-containing protein [Listeria monocytogenes]